MSFSPEAPRAFLNSDAMHSKLLHLRQLITFTLPENVVNSGNYEMFRYKVYLILEEPRSSMLALAVNIFLTVCIVASTVVFAIETIPSQEVNSEIWWHCEIFFVVVFITEYCFRLWSRQVGWLVFITRPMNIVDLLAVLPFFLEVTILYTGGYLDMRFLRSIRLLRLFKFGRHSTQLQLIIGGLRKSVWPLGLVFLMLSLALVLFGTAMYMVERGTWDNAAQCYVRSDGNCSPFESIPKSFWWGIATLTTVGYGDVYPITTMGRFVAAWAMVVGILCVALPTTVLGVQFSEAYGDLKAKMEMEEIRAVTSDKTDLSPAQRSTTKGGVSSSGAAMRLVASLDALHVIKKELETVLPQIRNDLQNLANPDVHLFGGTNNFASCSEIASLELEKKADSLDAVVERGVAVLGANSVNAIQTYINFVLATTEEYFTMGSNQ